jgi:hypothetical protein
MSIQVKDRVQVKTQGPWLLNKGRVKEYRGTKTIKGYFGLRTTEKTFAVELDGKPDLPLTLAESELERLP